MRLSSVINTAVKDCCSIAILIYLLTSAKMSSTIVQYNTLDSR